MENLDERDNKAQNSFFLQRIVASQFVLIGEQHGIKEVGQFTGYIYRLSHPLGYDYLCIETDSLAARYIETFSEESSRSSTIQKALELHTRFPFAIPFYDNYDNYELFRNVVHTTEKSGPPRLWGIDTVYFLEWGFTFSHLFDNTTDADTKSRLKALIEQSKAGFKEGIGTGNLKAFMFYQYDEEVYKNLLDLYTTRKEKRLLDLLWKSREYNATMFQGERYRSTHLRATIMKQNFTNYYKQALQTGSLPKVVFKMGYDHVGKGRNSSNVYDIGNFAAELARYNNLNSFHIKVMGLNGYENHHGPFSPARINEFDNTKNLPEEIQSFINSNPVNSKYLVINLEPFRDLKWTFSAEFEELFCRYDILILAKNCEAIEEFGQN